MERSILDYIQVEVRIILPMGVNSKGHIVAKANIVNSARQQVFLMLLHLSQRQYLQRFGQSF